MKTIKYTEFSVTSEITKYHPIAKALKGMRDGKPFVMNSEIHVNLDEQLHVVDLISFHDTNGNTLLREEVSLDTDTRVGAAIINSGNVLLINRIKPDRNYFAFPGGHVRESESLEAALIRELREETAIDIGGFPCKLLLETHKKEYGPEKFYLVDTGNSTLDYRPEEEDDRTSKLFMQPIQGLLQLENVFPVEMVPLLLEKC